jgi:choline dehydrogenase
MAGQPQMEADYIIIGAGSAGSVLALRLAEGGRNRVLVLEYGGSDAGPFVQMPAALSWPMNMAAYDWGYRAAAEDRLNGRALACPRGKVIGGSSSINGMIFVRGHPADFDSWAEAGAKGWDFASLLPYFKRMETSHGAPGDWRGTDGPLHITRGPRDNILHSVVTRAAEQAGYQVTQDYNGWRQEGFGAADMTVWQGRRWSTANAFLRPALKTGSVQLIKRALATQILFDGLRARGVRYRRGGHSFEARARKAVILAAGAINSPQLLQASGIGPAEWLQQAGVPVLLDRAGVGRNLQDHLEIYLQMHCLQPVSLYPFLSWHQQLRIALQWALFKTGIGASNQFETLGFIRSDKGIAWPDIQFHFLPLAVRYDGKSAASGHGFQLHLGPMRSQSRGTVRLLSADPASAPEICFNYLSHADDLADFRKAIRLGRDILAQAAFAPFRGAEIQPGDACQSDEGLDEFVRNHAESAYHPCGTCKMGAPSDPAAVVDPACRVIGTGSLFVADSSIFPQITNGNLNAPTIMVAEKAADHVLGKPPLAPANNQPWQHPDWQNSQR